LQELTIQKQFIRGQGVPIGKVRTLRGHLIVRHGNSPQAYFAARGDNLYAHDELFTLKKSRVRIRFTTADIVNMGADTRIRVDELVDDRQKRVKRTKMNMVRGKAMFYVMRLLKYNRVDTQVTTPTAVCGVRGTKFGLIVKKKTDNLWSMGQPLYLADASGMPLSRLLAANGGANSLTIMLMEAGVGFIKSGGVTTDLNTGQTGTSGPTGPPSVTRTDPSVSLDLNNTTDPGAGAGGTGDTGGTGVDDTGDDPNAANRATQDATNQNANVTQQALTDARPTEHKGYFSALLSEVSPSPYPLYVFQAVKLHDHDNEPVPPGIVGTTVAGGGDEIEFHPGSGSEPILKKVYTPYGMATLNLPVTGFEIGFNAWQEWGFWEVPQFNFLGTSYIVQGVYVHGDPTPKDNITGIAGHFSGDAWGILQIGANKYILSEGKMDVDLVMGSPEAQNFKFETWHPSNPTGLRVEGDQTGTITFDGPNGEATLEHYSNIIYKIGGMDANYGSGHLGVFGNGEAAGGTSAIDGYSGEKAAVGYQGTQTAP